MDSNGKPLYKVTGTEVGYPGGKWFDPLGMSTTKEVCLSLRLARPGASAICPNLRPAAETVCCRFGVRRTRPTR